MLDNELQTFLGLVDVIYAYAYDERTTMGEHTVESWWTVSRLSATLSWFDVRAQVSHPAGLALTPRVGVC